MFESTGWILVESANEDNNKYDNISPTIVSWTPPNKNKQELELFNNFVDSGNCAQVLFNKE